MNAEIVSIGTELLLGDIVDSHASHLGRLLAELGISHYHRQTVGDNLERITDTLRLALSRAQIVITIGGLGPTEDDLTRDAIALALDDPLIHDPEIENDLRALFQRNHLTWTESQLKQARRPSCSTPVANPNGTAPGLLCQKKDRWVFALPGPPSEFLPMANGPLKARLSELAGDHDVIHSKVLKVCDMGEALVEQQIFSLLHSDNPTVAPYAKPGEVHIRLTARAHTISNAKQMISPVEQKIREILGNNLFGTDDQTLEGVVIEQLIASGKTVSVAESCTGGGLGSRLSSIPGSSQVFLGGVIAYSNQVKQQLLGVSESTLDSYGAVSKECAIEMAERCKAIFSSTCGISITGIAGPGGGSAEKPTGLVFIALAGLSGTKMREFRFQGERNDVRWKSTQAALAMIFKDE